MLFAPGARGTAAQWSWGSGGAPQPLSSLREVRQGLRKTWCVLGAAQPALGATLLCGWGRTFGIGSGPVLPRALTVGRGETGQVLLLRAQLIASAEHNPEHLKLGKLNKL